MIGVDTGLTHIAAQQGTPTVTICRRSSVYFRPWSHCRVLRGERCTEECIAVEAAYAYNDQVSLGDLRPDPRTCPSGAPCLDRTAPGPGRRSAAGTAVTVRAAAAGDVVEIDAAAEIGVRNSQPHGIGRVVVLGDLICWNNLGRNVVFADGRCRPACRLRPRPCSPARTSPPSTTWTFTPSSTCPTGAWCWC